MKMAEQKKQVLIERPWGGYTILKKTNLYWVKKLFVNKSKRLSLQSHALRNEVWYVLSGEILVQLGNKEKHLYAGDVIFIPKLRKHRITAVKKSCVLEFAFGRVLESDIVRYEDDFGRTK